MIAMLLQVACVFLTSKATSLDYDDLVADVKSTLDECLGIVEDVGRYVDEVNLLQGVSRRNEDESDNHSTDVKLGACVSILQAVDTYREDHSRQVLYQEFLRLEEKAYLHELLEPLSKKMGDLLYVASTDGDDFSDFRSACGNQETLLIIESTNGAVFGGYTDADWTVAGSWQSSSTAFLFRLRPSFEQWGVTAPIVANWINDDYLHFGNALNIPDHFLSHNNSRVSGAHYAVDGFELNDGIEYFQAKEFVAVKIVNL